MEQKNQSTASSALKNFATQLKAKNNFIKASFGGFAGSGKTRTATELIIGCYQKFQIKNPLLIIDNEKGSRFLVPIFEKAGIETYVKDTMELADILSAFDMLNKGEIGFLFMDSLSKVWYKFIRDYKQKNNVTFMTLNDWGKILPDWQQRFSDKFVELNGNCVFTGRGGFTYDMEEDEKTHKKSFVKSGVKMKLAGETPFEPDLNIWMELEQDIKDNVLTTSRSAQIMKDRSGLIDGKIFINPTFKDFEPVIDFLMNVPKGEVAGATNSENLAPSENYEAQDRRQKREIYLEEIKAVFDALSLGASNDAKKLKVAILEKLFETASWTALEKTKLEKLEKGVLILKSFKLLYQKENPDTYERALEILNDASNDLTDPIAELFDNNSNKQ